MSLDKINNIFIVPSCDSIVIPTAISMQFLIYKYYFAHIEIEDNKLSLGLTANQIDIQSDFYKKKKKREEKIDEACMNHDTIPPLVHVFNVKTWTDPLGCSVINYTSRKTTKLTKALGRVTNIREFLLRTPIIFMSFGLSGYGASKHIGINIRLDCRVLSEYPGNDGFYQS